VAHAVRAIVMKLASYEVIQGKPWFTRHKPIVDWRQNRLRLNINGKSVEIDASLDPQCQGPHALTRISATQLKKVVRRKEPVYLVLLSQMGVEGNLAEIVNCRMHGNACSKSSRMYSSRTTRSTPVAFCCDGD
jgi:hypothetical protein